MNNDAKIIILIDCAMLLLDMITIVDLRRFLLDFISGKKSRKYADKIYASQSVIRKITLSFIRENLKKHFKVFTFYYRTYLTVIYTLVPQYVCLIVSNFVIGTNSIYVFGVFFVAKFMICLLVRFNVDSNRISLYRKK